MGNLTCVLFPKAAPLGVANFIGLARGTKDWKDPKSGKTMHGVPLYDNTIFHRVIPEFMIQGGDPAGAGSGEPRLPVQERNLARSHLRSARPSRLRQRRTRHQRLAVLHHRGAHAVPRRQLHHLRPVRRRQRGAGQEDRPPAPQRTGQAPTPPSSSNTSPSMTEHPSRSSENDSPAQQVRRRRTRGRSLPALAGAQHRHSKQQSNFC